MFHTKIAGKLKTHTVYVQ